MHVDESETIDKALDLKQLERHGMPSSPRVVKVPWGSYLDSSGEQSLEIHVVLDDRTTDREIEQAPIHAIKGAIMDSLAEHGVPWFPYFFFERESEHETPIREE